MFWKWSKKARKIHDLLVSIVLIVLCGYPLIRIISYTEDKFDYYGNEAMRIFLGIALFLVEALMVIMFLYVWRRFAERREGILFFKRKRRPEDGIDWEDI